MSEDKKILKDQEISLKQPHMSTENSCIFYFKNQAPVRSTEFDFLVIGKTYVFEPSFESK